MNDGVLAPLELRAEGDRTSQRRYENFVSKIRNKSNELRDTAQQIKKNLVGPLCKWVLWKIYFETEQKIYQIIYLQD